SWIEGWEINAVPAAALSIPQIQLKFQDERGRITRGLVSKTGQEIGPTQGPPERFQVYPPITVAKVTDGTSKTVAVMEKAVWSQFYQPVGDGGNLWDWTEIPGWAFGFDWPNMRMAPPVVGP